MTSGKDFQILVIDDEPFILKLTVKLLDQLGYQNVLTATDGQSALEILNAPETFLDIIICDLNMPVMDGVEFMRHAKKCNFTGALIVLSGEDQRMLDTAMNFATINSLYVLGTLNKPVAMALLKDLLEKYSPRRDHISSARFQPLAEERIRNALTATDDVSELVLHYQPKINVKTGQIDGVEALARWQTEEALLPPYCFISVSEEGKLISNLSLHIFRRVLRDQAAWQQQGIEITTSVNFSINTFTNPKIPSTLLEYARNAGVMSSRIIFEVSETQVMRDANSCLDVLMRLRLNKFKLSIDDFGTGSSSLRQLKAIPFDELKIDREYVHGAGKQESRQDILEASIALGKSLGMNIVAEGVENRSDWDAVERLGVDQVQGYYCARPMSAQALAVLAKGWQGPHKRG